MSETRTIRGMVPGTPMAPDYVSARQWLWRVLAMLVVGAWAGTTWDQVWHATVPFDGFWSPPHLVVYLTVALVAFAVMGMLFHSPVRRAFGRGFVLGILPFKVPGALFILGFGILLLGLAGAVLDNLWHTAFGLNETGWSFPHAMIGWSLNLVAFGIVACRLAMVPIKPLPWTTVLIVGGLTASMLLGSILGPIGSNRTPATVDFFFTHIPALASQESAQNVYRIYASWNLNRTNPALLLIAPVAMGVILAWTRSLDKRWWTTLLVITLVYLMDSGSQDLWTVVAQFMPEYAREEHWRALPVVIPTALLLLLTHIGIGELWAYPLVGVLFALMIYGIWDGVSGAWLLCFAAAPLILLGRQIGMRLYGILAQPWSLGSVLPLVAGTVIIPAVTGVADLVLRWLTP